MRLHSLLTDHAVLQADEQIIICGWAEPDEAIAVTFANNQVITKADINGKWGVELPALPAGGNYELVVTGKNDAITVSDIVMGDVWVCSGQSNMEWPVNLSDNAEEEVAAANYPLIRHNFIPHVPSIELTEYVDSPWKVCTSEVVGDFTAVGYYFGREVHLKTGRPIGLINSSWGGTVAETWVSHEGLDSVPGLKHFTKFIEVSLENRPELEAKYKDLTKDWTNAMTRPNPENIGYAAGWAKLDHPTDDWCSMILPRTWQSAGCNFNGVLWFRKIIELPAEWEDRELTLHIGACDKTDDTYFNNVRVGGLSSSDNPGNWCKPRIYKIPAELVKSGSAVIAVRVFSGFYSGGMIGPNAEMIIHPADDHNQSFTLSGPWEFNIENNMGLTEPPALPALPFGDNMQNCPTMLYNGMIYPLLPLPIKGAIWYQGESNAGRSYEYRTLFPALIVDWRNQWKKDDLPFNFVELANFQPKSDEPGDSDWAELREAQRMALKLVNTGLASAVDIGEAMDIHPRNKQEVGRRLALNAFATTYGYDIVPMGPIFSSALQEVDKIRVFFEYKGSGLVAKDGELTGFEIAGEDKKFVWAEAYIENNTVVVKSPIVTRPVAVRYGWANNPIISLYNAQGLPASPFRTDNWGR
jgi:sialate O-acetylesterase